MIPFFQRNFVLPIIETIRREPISRCLAELRKTQWYSNDQLKDLQWRKLKRLLDHCYQNVPFYRKRFQELQLHPQEIRNLEDYSRLPVLTKDDLRSSQKSIRDANHTYGIEHMHSGGTLGAPMLFVRDKQSSAYVRASHLRGLEWHGIRKGDKQLRVWGVPFDDAGARRSKLKDLALNRIKIPPFAIGDDTVRDYFRIMKRFRPNYIYGYTSGVYKICQLIDELGLDGGSLNVRLVVCTAETLHAYQKSRIEQAMNCSVINEYGCSETGPIAFECPEGSMHLTMENVLVEFVEEDSHPGCAELLLTNLNCYVMPLLRYRIGDAGHLLESKCSCGRDSDIMGIDAARVMSLLRATDGHYVSGTIFAYIAFDVIERHGGIKDFRVVQKERDRLEISLVKDANFSDRILGLFTSEIREHLGSSMQIDYVFTNEIALEASGKRLYVCSELSE